MQEYLVLLRQILTERFDEEELRTLCFDLGIRYDDLPGRGKVAKARELVAHLERRERIPDCIEVGKLSRPDIIWEKVQLAWLEAAQEVASDPRRFQHLIDELQATIGLGEGRVERQRERIAAGLMEERQRRAEEQARRHERERVRVVGQPPLDVANYFKDRQRELEELTNALVEPTTRLVSVIGHGGMGKTALTCKALQDLERHRWPQTDEDLPVDGIVYLSTRTAGISLERLFLDCAKLLGGKSEEHLNAVWTNPQLEIEKKIVLLLNALSDGRYVILLDNLEDLLDDQGQFLDDDLRLFFDQALTAGHGAQLVVTSRVGLAFRREVMRFNRQVKLLKGLPMEDGMALLRELDPNGDYGLRDALEEELAEAVRLTYGVPRALEVLAGILANDPFVSLSEVMETFYEQEDVVQALIEENYRRLDRDARRVIEALAVFGKPVPVLAVDYLLEPFAPGLDVPVVIRRLTRTNIVSVDRVAKLLTLHPIDQDYAYSQLQEENETELDYTREALERRAADYYFQLRTPQEKWNSIEDLEPQLSEFEHRVRSSDYDHACRVLESIDEDYLFMWGHYARLADMREQLIGHLSQLRLRSANLGGLGKAYQYLGRTQQAFDLYQQALKIEREIDVGGPKAKWLFYSGLALSDMGNVNRAIDCYQQALKIYEKSSDRQGAGRMLGMLGVAYRLIGDIQQSVVYGRKALEISKETEDRVGEGIWLGNLGTSFRQLGKSQQAIEHYLRALEIAREINDRQREAEWLGNLSIAYRQIGNPERSEYCCRQALEISRHIYHRRGEGQWLHNLGAARHSRGYVKEAIEYYNEALIIARDVRDARQVGNRLQKLGNAYLEVGQIARAMTYHKEAMIVARDIANLRGLGKALVGLGRDFGALGESEQAAEYIQSALRISQEMGDHRKTGQWLAELGNILLRDKQFEPAIESYQKSIALFKSVGNRWGENYSLLILNQVLYILGRISEVRYNAEGILESEVSGMDHRAALLLGIVSLESSESRAKAAFEDAISRCRSLLDKTETLWEPRYTLAAALIGQVICEPRWVKVNERPALLTPALKEYHCALEITAAPGVVQDAIRDLELIQAAGIEGLEPVFKLLENAEYEPDEDLPDILKDIQAEVH
jgi:tetratricopeptide (TPR) repeat protein